MQSNENTLAPVERDHFEKANAWDVSRAERSEVSERRAWRVATGACLVAVVAVFAVAVMATRHSVEPFLVRVDTTTGAPDIVSMLRDVEITGDEVQDKYWIGRYVEARETYDWHTLQADYDAVGLFSAGTVGGDYAALFSGDEALQDRWGQSVRATIEIRSIVLAGNNSATVRFTKTTTRARRRGTPDVTNWIATLGYRYDTRARISESQRRTNPLGFKVTSYRVDPESVGGGT